MSKLTWLKMLKNSTRNCTFDVGAEAEVLGQPHVPGLQRRPVVGALADVAEGAEIVRREGRRIEDHTQSAPSRPAGVDVGAGQLRAIVADAVERVVGAADDGERTAGLILHDARPLPAAERPSAAAPAMLAPGRSHTHDVVKR